MLVDMIRSAPGLGETNYTGIQGFRDNNRTSVPSSEAIIYLRKREVPPDYLHMPEQEMPHGRKCDAPRQAPMLSQLLFDRIPGIEAGPSTSFHSLQPLKSW